MRGRALKLHVVKYAKPRSATKEMRNATAWKNIELVEAELFISMIINFNLYKYNAASLYDRVNIEPPRPRCVTKKVRYLI